MHHLVSSRAVVGSGPASVLLELCGHSVRIKRRGMPDLFLPLEAAAEVGRFLVAVGDGGTEPGGAEAQRRGHGVRA